ncbi:MAG: hypothetical protein NTZ17_04370, partial [Phycisphaerae bacterium]|nr:hypothetical protein [Phycisphaerae bacterium]
MKTVVGSRDADVELGNVETSGNYRLPFRGQFLDLPGRLLFSRRGSPAQIDQNGRIEARHHRLLAEGRRR